ncbi:MAG: aminotransferase class I/II-fold pyridoxal phosphate-dependent enzyme [bacterium]
MKHPFAQRLNSLPPYLFSELNSFKSRARRPLLDLGEGNPDLPPAPSLLKALARALKKPKNHRYPSYAGKLTLRIAFARWYRRRFGVELNPETELLTILGSKEGAAHLLWAVCDRGDTVGLLDPGYPVYLNSTRLCGATPIIFPLEEHNRFLPDLDFISRLAPRLKLLCLNFPNNPTTAVATIDFYRQLVHLALKYGFYIINDNVYSEIYFSQPPPSILQVPDAKDCAVELHSLSKTFSIPGWRLGVAAGNERLLTALLKIKENVDSGPFGAIQDAAIFALNQGKKSTEKLRLVYRRRRDLFLSELSCSGWELAPPEATFYLWAKLPEWWRETHNGSRSLSFALSLIENCRVVCAPGNGFGASGEGYVRFALVAKETQLKLAAARISRWLVRRAQTS